MVKWWLGGAMALLLAGLGHAQNMAHNGFLHVTFRIYGANSSGTCFLVNHGKKTYLVTAAHVLEGIKEKECKVAFRRNRLDNEGNLIAQRQDLPVQVRDNDKPLWTKHPQADVAVLPFSLPKGQSPSGEMALEPFTLDQFLDDDFLKKGQGFYHTGQEVFIPCFPAKLESNPAGFPILRKGTIASSPLAPAKTIKTILLDIRTFGGDSGAPVILAPTGPARISKGGTPTTPGNRILGMSLGMVRQTDRTVSPFEERTVHTPLGLGIALPAVFLRETVEMAARDKEASAKP
ncbi:MAG: serine protease [Gemmataceae bacterium]